MSDSENNEVNELDSDLVFGDELESGADLEFCEELDWSDDQDGAGVSCESREPVSENEGMDFSDESSFSAEGTELEHFESAQIETEESLHDDQIISIVESLLFATDKPQSVATLKQAFKGTNVRSHHIRRALEELQTDYAGARRGVSLEEVSGGYQLRTKLDNVNYLKRMVKARPFRVSGPALEVLSIIAYKQPCTKSQVDEIRGVESGHLMRALMEKNLVHFEGKSDLPGKPMLYGTTRKFLEIFSLRNLKELPSLSEIDELIPEGIGEVEERETLDVITANMSQEAGVSYSQGEEELVKIAEDLQKVATTTEFFEQEKLRMKKERDQERAKDLQDALTVGEEVSSSDRRWLDKFLAAKAPADIEPMVMPDPAMAAKPGEPESAH